MMNQIVALKGTPLHCEGFFHEHYKYKLKFNSVSKTNLRSKCEKDSHLQLKLVQCDKQYWETNPTTDYSFVGDTHCCSIETVAETKQASNATASRAFPVTIMPSESHLGVAHQHIDTVNSYNRRPGAKRTFNSRQGNSV